MSVELFREILIEHQALGHLTKETISKVQNYLENTTSPFTEIGLISNDRKSLLILDENKSTIPSSEIEVNDYMAHWMCWWNRLYMSK